MRELGEFAEWIETLSVPELVELLLVLRGEFRGREMDGPALLVEMAAHRLREKYFGGKPQSVGEILDKDWWHPRSSPDAEPEAS
jgi:hypothetical protein